MRTITFWEAKLKKLGMRFKNAEDLLADSARRVLRYSARREKSKRGSSRQIFAHREEAARKTMRRAGSMLLKMKRQAAFFEARIAALKERTAWDMLDRL